MSTHTDKAIAKARRHKAASAHPAARPLWDRSKRELIEALIHSQAALTGTYDTSVRDGVGAMNALSEIENLHEQGLV